MRKKRVGFYFILIILCVSCVLFACSERPKPTGFTVRFETFTEYFIPNATASVIEKEPDARKEGFVLEGWYEDEELNAAKRVEFPFYPEQDTVLYAKYIDLTVGNEEITYSLAEGGDGYEVTAYTGFSGNVVIPKMRNGLPVTALQVGFLKNSSYLRQLYFYSLERIDEIFYFSYGFRAFVQLGDGGNFSVEDGVLYDASGETLICYPISKFDGSSRQTELNLPEKTKAVASDALRNAVYLEKITFGRNFVELNENFHTLTSLKSIKTSDNPNFYTEDGVLYSGDKTKLLRCPISIEREVYALLPDTLEVVDEAFEKCKLNKIVINSSLKKFGLHSELENLESFSVPVDNAAYFSEDGVLYSASGELIKYPAGKEGEDFRLSDKATSIGAFAFNGTGQLKSLRVNPKLKTVSAYAFGGGNGAGLERITVEDGSELSEISEHAFADCGDITLELLCRVPPKFSGRFPANVKSIVVPINLVGLYLAIYPQFSGILTTNENGVEPHKIIYNSNGGSEVDELICAYVLIEPNPVKDGFVFGGWYSDENCATERISFPLAVTEDVELFALWISK